MTKKKIKLKILERIKELKASREKLIDNVSAHNGALEQCEWFLQELEKEDKPDEKIPDSDAVSATDFIHAVERKGG